MHKLNAAICLFLWAASFASQAHAESKRLSMAQVEEIALRRFPASSIEEIEHESERGREVFEVELRTKDGTKHEIEIDAYSGAVLEVDDKPV
jgi:uncharacterized membrane protein YkoI